MSKSTNKAEPVEPVEDAGPDLVTERFTSGGEGPEGQPDTVVEDSATSAHDPSLAAAPETQTEG